jgi:hypothetical protein
MIIDELKLVEKNFSDFELPKELHEHIINIYQVNFRSIASDNPIFIAHLDITTFNLRVGPCYFCLFMKLREDALRIFIDEIEFSCNGLCTEVEKELKSLTGIDASGCIIFFEKKSMPVKSDLLSLNKNYTISLDTLEETVCSVNCCGDLEPRDYMKRGCWIKEENCCPLKSLLNKCLKDNQE